MASFSLSPSVEVNEFDLTAVIPAVATSVGAMVGQFAWGPVEEIVTLSVEGDLSSQFGLPNDTNFADWFSASSYLSYATDLKNIRVVGTGALNGTMIVDSNGQLVGGAGLLVKNDQTYQNTTFTKEVFVAKYPGAYGNNIGVAWANTTSFNAVDSNGIPTWEFHDAFPAAPGAGQYHVAVYDATGVISGTIGTVLERFSYVTTVPAKYADGTSSFITDKLSRSSAWVWMGEVARFINLAASTSGVQFTGGADGAVPTDGQRQTGYALFQDAEANDVTLVMQAGGSIQVGQWIIDNIAEYRRDCVAYVSPALSDVVGLVENDIILNNIITTRTFYGSSSYAFMDGNYKYMYDQYNDTYRWIPLNADMAGLAARTDYTNDAWWSPAGYNRGTIKNVVKLAWNPNKTFRDSLYNININPVISETGQGPFLFGDKTLYNVVTSAFISINVRRLFIVLEKAISTAAKFTLFEFNDYITRAMFVNMVTPYLRTVQGRRGVTAFQVICDETNNTGDIIDAQEFVADIYVRPNRSINVIVLNFTAVGNSVSFSELTGTTTGTAV